MSNIVWDAEHGWHDGPIVCDWLECRAVAVNTVRRDVPRGHNFFSIIRHRCDEHTPEYNHGTFVTPLERVS